MAEQCEYTLTHHVRERYIQRTNRKYAHLQTCRATTQCYNCDALLLDIRHELTASRGTIDQEIYDRLEDADEDRSYINNSGFMEWYHEKYGFDKRFEFLVHDDILFVIVHDEGKKVVVTCVCAKTHMAGKNLLAKPKFNRIKTKEEKLLEAAK